MRTLIVVLMLMSTTANAGTTFALDLVGWNNTPPPSTPSQKALAEAYLRGVREAELFHPESEVAQVMCQPLALDLLKGQEFFHCHLVFKRNAIDGGPFDSGMSVAWDGKELFFHGRLDFPLKRGHGISGLRFHTVAEVKAMQSAMQMQPKPAPSGKPEAAARELSDALNRAIAERLAKERPAAELPEWFKTVLSIHHESPPAKWYPGVPDGDFLAKASGGPINQKALDKALGLSRLSEKPVFQGTVSLFNYNSGPRGGTRSKLFFERVELRGGELELQEVDLLWNPPLELAPPSPAEPAGK
jgi:hypothetical protein